MWIKQSGEGKRLKVGRGESGKELATLSFFAALTVMTLYPRQDTSLFPVLLIPIAAHELGHLLALGLLGFRLCSLGLEAKGLLLRYDGPGGYLQEAALALAGPAAGLLYALAVLSLPGKGSAWLCESGYVSLLLSGFNLLPIPPLDGGRALCALCMLALDEEKAERLLNGISRAMLAVLFAAGVALLFVRQSAALLAAALWLLLENERLPLVKGRKLL